MKSYYIYILASKYNKALYIGVTSNLVKRVWEQGHSWLYIEI
ncbi:GIY-YIG nuclease family protein [Wolbachia pipientis]